MTAMSMRDFGDNVAAVEKREIIEAATLLPGDYLLFAHRTVTSVEWTEDRSGLEVHAKNFAADSDWTYRWTPSTPVIIGTRRDDHRL